MRPQVGKRIGDKQSTNCLFLFTWIELVRLGYVEKGSYVSKVYSEFRLIRSLNKFLFLSGKMRW